MVIIRRAKSADMQQLLMLWHEMMDAHKGMHPDFRVANSANLAISTNFMTLLDGPSGAIIVAESEGRIVGMLLAQTKVGLPYSQTRLSGYIRDVAVTKEFRRRGIGKQLVDEAIKFLKSQNVEYIDLITGTANETSNEFWEAMDFKESLKIRTMWFIPNEDAE